MLKRLSLSQPIQIIQVIIERILTCAPQLCQLFLELYSFFGMSGQVRELFFRKLLLLFIKSRGVQQCIEVFLSRRALAGIHPAVDLIHFQIVPGNGINVGILPVLFVITADMGISLRRNLLL